MAGSPSRESVRPRRPAAARFERWARRGGAAPGSARPTGARIPRRSSAEYRAASAPAGNRWRRPVASNGFLLAPMRRGIRLTTGAEFARPSAEPTPVQLRRAAPIARTLLPLGDAVEQTPWMGIRPCTPDMLPIIGPAPSQARLWFAFGH